jgi:cyanophycin synthetase
MRELQATEDFQTSRSQLSEDVTSSWSGLIDAIDVYQGPNLFARFKAVVATFSNASAVVIDADAAQRMLRRLIPADFGLLITLPAGELRFEDLTALLTSALLDLFGHSELPVELVRAAGSEPKLAVGFYDPLATKTALNAGIQLTAATLRRAGGAYVDRASLAVHLRHAAAIVRRLQPDDIARALMRAARARGIPVYPLLPPGARTWMYGQGACGHRFFEAATHQDGLVGVRLSRNKAWSNLLVRQLGFPGVTHMVARDAAHARDLALKIGYPVVVKPATGAKGRGVTVGVGAADEMDVAFARADAVAPGQVLIEGFVAGDDYRLSVFGHQLTRASLLTPAYVLGDGVHSIEWLIEAANRRCRDGNASTLSRPITLDADAIALIAKQGFALSDHPPADARVMLRKTANLNTGGTLQDMTHAFHPDNIAMAEAIARNFHLDAAGIDFITPDPSVSWRDISCGVIEVNATPGIGDFIADKILARKFPDGFDGRIPSILLVELPADFSDQVMQTLQQSVQGVGFTNVHTTSLGGIRRFSAEAELPDRIMGLLLDPACQALVVSVTVEEVIRYGVPHTPYDLVLWGSHGGSEFGVHALVKGQATTMIEIEPSREYSDLILDAIDVLVGRRAQVAEALAGDERP